MIDLIIFLSLITTGYVVGQTLERRHYRAIERREAALLALPTTSTKRSCGAVPPGTRSELVQGACCISIDYFKRIAASLRQLFGGRVSSYETLVDRARREAILRLKEGAGDAHQIINLRLETSSITKGQGGQVGAIEVHAYATALYDH